MNGGIPAIKTTIGSSSWRARRTASMVVGRTIGSTVVLSLAGGAAMLVASRLTSGSPWTGLNGVAALVGLGSRRAKRRFDASATLVGAGVLAAGLLLFASLFQGTRTMREMRGNGVRRP